MVIDMSDVIVLLNKISKALKSKQGDLKLHRRKSSSVNFEKAENNGDQLFKHPVFKEIADIRGK